MVVHDDGDGFLWTEVDGMPGCFASGANVEELVEAVAEAVVLYVSEK